jgi:hypothetical protein
MKFYFKTMLPYFLMLVLNYYVVKYSFIGMTAPYDWSFAAGLLAIMAIAVADVKFVISRVKKITSSLATPTQEETHEDHPSA